MSSFGQYSHRSTYLSMNSLAAIYPGQIMVVDQTGWANPYGTTPTTPSHSPNYDWLKGRIEEIRKVSREGLR